MKTKTILNTHIFMLFAFFVSAQVEIGELGNVYNESCNGSIEVIVEGQEGPYAIEFEGGGLDLLISPINDTYTFYDLCAGTYFFTVTNAYGCAIDLGPVILLDCPTITLSPPSIQHPTDCNANDGYIRWLSTVNVIEGGTEPYTGAWQDENGIDLPLGFFGWSRITDLPAGTYFLTLIDANNCTQEFSYTLNGGGQPTVFYDVDPQCEGEANGIIQLGALNPQGGNSTYDFQWSNGTSDTDVNISVIDGLLAGNYVVTISPSGSSGCTAVENIEVPFVPIETLIVQTETEIGCYRRGNISVVVTGGTGGFTYELSNGYSPSSSENTFLFNNLYAGSYCLTVTDVCGNSGVDCIDVATYPEIVITDEVVQDDVASGGQGSIDITVSGGTGPYTYLWSNFQSTEDISGLYSGTYAVTVTDVNGCKKVEEFLIVTCGDEALLTTDIDILNATPCDPETGEGELVVTVIGGQPPYSYEWVLVNAGGGVEITYDNNAPSLTTVTGGWHIVTVTDLCGSQSTSVQTISCSCDFNGLSHLNFKIDDCIDGSISKDNSSYSDYGEDCTKINYVTWPDGSQTTFIWEESGVNSDVYTILGESSYEITNPGYHCITIRNECGCERERCWYFGDEQTFNLNYKEPISDHLSYAGVTANFPVYVGCGECEMCGPDEYPLFNLCLDGNGGLLENKEPFEYQPENPENPCPKGNIICLNGGTFPVPIGTQFTMYVDESDPQPADGGCVYVCHCLYPSDAFDQLSFDAPVLVETELFVAGDDSCDEPPPPPGDEDCPSGLYDYVYTNDCFVDTYCYDEDLPGWVYVTTTFEGEICYENYDPPGDYCKEWVSCIIDGDYHSYVNHWVPCDPENMCPPTPMASPSTPDSDLRRITSNKYDSGGDNEDVPSSLRNSKGIKIYPNPTTGILHVEFLNDTISETKISILDMIGQEVYKENIAGQKRREKVSINLENELQSGIYYILIEQKNKIPFYQKFVYTK